MPPAHLFPVGHPPWKPLAALLAAVVLAGLAATGFWMLFSHLAGYDDEGYILLSARDYFAHGRLYDGVYSQYGPAFYVFTDALQHLLAAPVDHTSARLLTLALWLGTAVACAVLVLRATAGRLLALFTLCTTFLYLYFITDEPFHPGSLVIFTLAATLAVATDLLARERPRAAAVVLGAAGAVLLLTKINVGVFYLAALVVWAALHAAPPRWPRLAGLLSLVALAALAAALMHTLWRETWVQIYLALFVAGAGSLVATLDRATFVTPRHARAFLLSAVLAAALILGLVWLRGTSLSGLLDGVLLGPLRHPGNYSYPVDWRPGSLGLAAASLLLLLAQPWLHRRFSDAAFDRLVVALRLLLTAALLVAYALLMHARVIGAVFSYVAPLIWIWVVPLSGVGTPPALRAARGLLATVLLGQYLHAYPVGGSQVSWASFLFWPLAALGLGDVLRWFELNETRRAHVRRLWPAVATAVLAVLVGKLGWTAHAAHTRYAARSDLGLPGAASLRLPEAQRTADRLLALNASVHTDLLFSLPGMFSFNLWTGLPTPTPRNTTHRFSLLTEADQTAIIRSLEANPRAGLIVNDGLLQLMAGGSSPPRGPLHDFLRSHFAPVFQLEEFSFWVRRGRTIAPLGIARLTTEPSTRETILDLCLAGDGTPVHSVALRDVASPGAPPVHLLHSANTRVSLVAIDSAGRSAGPPQAVPWPFRARGLTRLSLRFPAPAAAFSPLQTALHLLDADGQSLDLARIAP